MAEQLCMGCMNKFDENDGSFALVTISAISILATGGLISSFFLLCISEIIFLLLSTSTISPTRGDIFLFLNTPLALHISSFPSLYLTV